jgi:putative ABC transport system permease protein
MDFWTIILNNLKRRKLRTLLTATGIGVGIAAIVSLVAISNGFAESWQKLVAKSGTDLDVVQGSTMNPFFSSIDERIVKRVTQIQGVKEIARTLEDMVTLNDRPYTIVMGLDPSEYPLRRSKILAGRTLTSGDYNEVTLGKTVIENLKLHVGDHVDIETMAFKIVGIFDSENVFEDGACVMPLKTLQMLINRPHSVSLLAIKLDDPTQVKEMEVKIQKQLPGYSVIEAKNFFNTMQGVKLAMIMAWVTSVIALAVGMIGTINTMGMSVFERTREIGILRAIGWRKYTIAKMVLGESLIIGILGWVIGSVSGAVAVQLITRLPSVSGFLYADLDVWLFTKALLVAVCLGMLGAVYPVYRAVKIEPVEAIRYE